MAKKKIPSFNDLLMNNKFVLVISLIFSIFLWAMLSMTIGEDEVRVIENVRVTIDENDNSLYKIFGYEETFVDVTVKGKKYLVSSAALSANDINVIAKSTYVDSAGVHKLKLTASVDKSRDIKITNISKSNIEVFYDIPKEDTFTVEPELKPTTTVVPDGYMVNDDPMSSVFNVTVSGPATQINRIDKFVATATITEPLTETTDVPATLSPVSVDGKNIDYIKYETDIDDLTVTVPVVKVKEIPLSVKFINAPSYYDENELEATIDPPTIRIAASEKVLDSLETLNIKTIDFNDLKNMNNVFEKNLSDVKEVTIIDDIDFAKISVNCSSMKSKVFTIQSDNIKISNIPENKTALVITQEIRNVVVVGTSDELDNLDDKKIFAKVDLSNAHDGTNEYKAVVYIKGAKKCWIYGAYNVYVTLTNN